MKVLTAEELSPSLFLIAWLKDNDLDVSDLVIHAPKAMEEYHQYATQIDADKLAEELLEGLLEDIKGMNHLYIIDYIKEQVDILKQGIYH